MAGKSAAITVKILGDGSSAIQTAEQVESRFDGMGAKLGAVGAKVGLAFGAAGVGALVGLEKIGATFDDALDSIALTTGETGAALDDLGAQFRDVFGSVPVSAEDAAAAIGKINQRLGATGEPLEALATQFLNLSRITDTDLGANIDAAADAFNGFGVAADEQSTKLDTLFKLSQQSGVAVADLATQMADGAVQFQAAGLTFDQAASMIAKLGEAGMSASDVLPGLSKAMAEAAAQGVPAEQVLANLFAAIQGAPDATAAAGIALDVLGAKAGPKFAEMIRSGKLSLEDFTQAALDAGPGINESAAATDDWREKLEVFKNKALLALEPIAERVFTGLGTLVENLAIWFEENWPRIQEIASATFQRIAELWEEYGRPTLDALQAGAEAIVAWVVDNWPQISATITDVLTTVQQVISGFVEVVTVIWNTWGEQIASFVQAKFEAIMGVIDGVLQVIRGIVQTVTALIHGDWSAAWEGIKQIFEGIWTAIVAAVTGFINEMRAIIEGVLIAIRGIWDAAWAGISSALSGAWEGIKGIVSGGVDAVVGFVTGIPGRLGGIASSLFDAVKQGATDAWNSVKTTVSDGITEIVDGIKAVPEKIKDFATLFLNAGWTIGNEIIEGFKNGLSKIGEAGAAIANGIIGGFKSAWNAAAGAINNLIPNEVKIGVGPVSYTVDLPDTPIPTFHHTGGTVPGVYGTERLAVLQAGEEVLSLTDLNYGGRGGSGGGLPDTVVLVIDGEEFTARVLVRRENVIADQASAGRR